MGFPSIYMVYFPWKGNHLPSGWDGHWVSPSGWLSWMSILADSLCFSNLLGCRYSAWWMWVEMRTSGGFGHQNGNSERDVIHITCNIYTYYIHNMHILYVIYIHYIISILRILTNHRIVGHHLFGIYPCCPCHWYPYSDHPPFLTDQQSASLVLQPHCKLHRGIWPSQIFADCADFYNGCIYWWWSNDYCWWFHSKKHKNSHRNGTVWSQMTSKIQ